jgi:hypothetical protein
VEWNMGNVIRVRSSWLPQMGMTGCKNVYAWHPEVTDKGFGHTMQFMRIVVEVRPKHLIIQGFNRHGETERVSIDEIEKLWRDGWLDIDTSNSYIYESERES